MKGIVRSNFNPETSLANDVQMDIVVRAISLDKDLLDADPPPAMKFARPIVGGSYFPKKRKTTTILYESDRSGKAGFITLAVTTCVDSRNTL